MKIVSYGEPIGEGDGLRWVDELTAASSVVDAATGANILVVLSRVRLVGRLVCREVVLDRCLLVTRDRVNVREAACLSISIANPAHGQGNGWRNEVDSPPEGKRVTAVS